MRYCLIRISFVRNLDRQARVPSGRLAISGHEAAARRGSIRAWTIHTGTDPTLSDRQCWEKDPQKRSTFQEIFFWCESDHVAILPEAKAVQIAEFCGTLLE
jgi:hypothetical protein